MEQNSLTKLMPALTKTPNSTKPSSEDLDAVLSLHCYFVPVPSRESLLGVSGQEGRGGAIPWLLGEPPDLLTSEEEDKFNETAYNLDVILKSFPEKHYEPDKTPKDEALGSEYSQLSFLLTKFGILEGPTSFAITIQTLTDLIILLSLVQMTLHMGFISTFVSVPKALCSFQQLP